VPTVSHRLAGLNWEKTLSPQAIDLPFPRYACIGVVNPHLQVIELQLELHQQHAQCAGELSAGVFQDPRQCRIDMAAPLP
jgi:hypothetical protein